MIPCRFVVLGCRAPAVVRVQLSAGCVCYPADRQQDLCGHHWYRAEPLGELTVIDLPLGGAARPAEPCTHPETPDPPQKPRRQAHRGQSAPSQMNGEPPMNPKTDTAAFSAPKTASPVVSIQPGQKTGPCATDEPGISAPASARPLPWDTPGLPTRLPEERCRWHEHCAYRDDDPNRCTLCHATIALGQCTCEHGPLTLAATDTIRGQFMAGASVREIMEDYGMGRDQARRILMGLLSRANPDEMDGTVL